MLQAGSQETESQEGTDNFAKAKSPTSSDTNSHSSDEEDDQEEQQLPSQIHIKWMSQAQPLLFRWIPSEWLDTPQLNDMCPLCDRRCESYSLFAVAPVTGSRFNVHYNCLADTTRTPFRVRNCPMDIPKAAITYNAETQADSFTPLQPRAFLELTISHAHTSLTFIGLEKRLNLKQSTSGKRVINGVFNHDSPRGYDPNYVGFPLSDLHVELVLDTNLSEPAKKYQFLVVFDQNLALTKKMKIRCQSGPVTLDLELYEPDFKNVVSIMNYKYKYLESPLLVLKGYSYTVPEDAPPVQPCQEVVQPVKESVEPLQQVDQQPHLDLPLEHPQTPEFNDYASSRSAQDNEYAMYGFNTNYNMFMNQQQQQLYEQQQQNIDYLSERSLSNHQYNMYNHSYMPTMMDGYGVVQTHYIPFDNGLQYNGNDRIFEVSSEKSANKHTSYTSEVIEDGSPKNDIQPLSNKQMRELIESHELLMHASTNNGSRQLQKYLRRCSSDEVEEVLAGIQNYLPSFVVDDYANYMLQSLISACNVDQRTRVVVKLSENLVELCKNKQGTHCLQALIAKVTTSKEFKLICTSIEHKFVELCEQLNSSHFLLKIIGSFPLQELQALYLTLTQNFLRLAQNKTAVLVIKAFMNKVLGRENMETVFVMLIAECLETIIQDPFGNYVVQHAYDIYKQDRCRPMTERLIQKLPQYSVQKFSSCVVEKCVGLYFNDIQADILHVLSENLEALEEMLKFPLAAHILQRLAKKNKTHVFVQNICKILNLSRMSKHSAGWDNVLYDNKEKSATCKNIKGESYSNFAQAVQNRDKAREPKKGSRTPIVK